jgi:hypothetical protein
MKQEYAEKFEIIRNYFDLWRSLYTANISDEECDRQDALSYGALETLEQSGDPEILRGLLALYTKENMGVEDFFENLYNTIKFGFTPEQIIEALSENGRFDAFMR